MGLKDLCVESTLYSVHWSTFGFVHWCCTGFIDFQVQRVEIVNTSRARDVDVTSGGSGGIIKRLEVDQDT